MDAAVSQMIEQVDKIKKLEKLLKESQESELLAMRNNEKLRKEIEILRQYGNKDCTAMADEELSRLAKES